MHVSSVEPKILAATPQAAVSEGLTAPADEEKGRKGGRQIDNENEEVGAMKKKKKKKGEGGRKKKKDMLIKRRAPVQAGRWPGRALVGHYISQDPGIHINQLAAVLQL